MKIKKVDDKPMVIHTKQKAKIHTHEPKQASIKGSNIYTVDRDPTKKKTMEGTYRKSTVHQVSKESRFAKLERYCKFLNSLDFILVWINEKIAEQKKKEAMQQG